VKFVVVKERKQKKQLKWKKKNTFCFSSVVNCRGFPRQLTAAGCLIPRQLTTEGAKLYFTCVSQPFQMCEQQFSKVVDGLGICEQGVFTNQLCNITQLI
jgi:hypothetical protein